MDKTTMLFIRACKVARPELRIASVYRRFYLPAKGSDYVLTHLNNILLDIIERYSLMKVTTVFSEMHPSQDWRYGGLTTLERHHAILLSAIRFADVNKFPGFISPGRFKQK